MPNTSGGMMPGAAMVTNAGKSNSGLVQTPFKDAIVKPSSGK